jgi:hypothetical protein
MSSLSASHIRRFQRLGVGAVAQPRVENAQPASSLAEDLNFFATTWLGGLVFFGTFLA